MFNANAPLSLSTREFRLQYSLELGARARVGLSRASFSGVNDCPHLPSNVGCRTE